MLKASVIVSTYNKPDWLEKVLIGYKVQDTSNFELIIADDGSREETQRLIQKYQKDFPVDLIHVWHEDNGYQRQKILNDAIVKSNHEYIIFSDGDCIPRNDFVSKHLQLAEKGRFLSGGYCKLPMETSKYINEEHIISQHCFDVKWLEKIEKVHWKNKLKLGAKGKEKLYNFFTPTNPTFNNCNSSAWKEDLLKINGYDERMQYGGPDRELGERLENASVRGKQIRYSTICMHLDHSRGYENKESWERNFAIRKEVKEKKLTWTKFGIKK
ncbi:MAG: glycosyltransferase family 2 protein [Flavobacteriales bacterium]|nr:glycosyltransferase family 2 protein [Flavobacteriales bacterium]